MRISLSKLSVSVIMTGCILQPSQAKDTGLVFDARNSQIGSGREYNQAGNDATKLSWRLGMDSEFLPEQFKASAGFTYKDDYKKGREGYETSMSWKLQKLKLTGKFSNVWTNQGGKSQQPEILDKWYIIESSYNLSGRPYSGIFFSYGTGSRQRNESVAQVSAYEEALTDVQAKFSFRYEILSFSIGARQYRLQNVEPGIDAQKENRIFINGNLFSEYPVSLQPSFRLNYKTGSAPGVKRNLENIETGLGLVYKPIQSSYRFTVKTAYENLLVPATNEERDVLKFAAKIDWEPTQYYPGRSSAWSINYQLKDIRGNINPNARSADWSISLIWSMPIG